MDETTRVITLPPKERVNIGLAALAGALAVLVVVTAHETFTPGPRAEATPAPTVIQSAAPTTTPAEAPAQRAAQPAQKNGKGKGRD